MKCRPQFLVALGLALVVALAFFPTVSHSTALPSSLLGLGIMIELTPAQVASILAQNAGAPATPMPGTVAQPPVTQPPQEVPVGVYTFAVDWANPQRLIIPDVPPGQIVAVEFTTGSTPTTNALCRISAGDYPSGTERRRRACFSLEPGDFAHPIGWGPMAFGQAVFEAPMGQVSLPFALNNAESYYPTLQLHRRYWLNVQNMSDQNGGLFIDLQRWGLV